MTVHYRQIAVDDVRVFYREAGRTDTPHVLLLHGFPTSSYMFRSIIPLLAEQYHVVAPDLPGFGFTEAPARETFGYRFDVLAAVIERFTEQLGLGPFAMMVFDHGAPVGFRLALRHPERITAIISQNGNAYVEGLGRGWDPIRSYWADPSDGNREALKGFLRAGTTKWQHMNGVHDPSLVAPESYLLDQALLDRPGNDDIQLDLFLDYASNIALYPAIHDYFRKHRPRTLVVWAQNDPFYARKGATAFRRDNPNAEVHLVDAGHFALETKGDEIGPLIVSFLNRVFGQPRTNRRTAP